MTTDISSLDYFSSLVLHDHSIPLFEAAVAIGKDRYPEVDYEACQNQIDTLANRLKQRITTTTADIQKLRILNIFFYDDLNFAGNVNDYYDPDNSYIHRVLETRRGIPISLAMIYMELAQHIDLQVMGISFPGHFLMKLRVNSGDIILDPLTGNSLSREELEERIASSIEIEDEDEPIALELYLRAAHPREILTRILRNLKAIFMENKQWAYLLDVQERLVLVLPDEITEKRDRGLIYGHLKYYDKGIKDLEAYLKLRPNTDDAEDISKKLQEYKTHKKNPH